jgi:EAL domain-containing protein (putative c-di-GMP-specific phosphodiesterase class I)
MTMTLTARRRDEGGASPVANDVASALRRLASPQSAAAMAPIADRAAAQLAHSRDRFLAFAFAAADMLIETGLDGVISFAAGAFRERFGHDGAAFIGQHVEGLIAPGDQNVFALALATMPLRGRIAPIVLRTSDRHATRSSVAAMLMPGLLPRLCFTIGMLPLPQDGLVSRSLLPDGTMTDAVRFSREAEAVLRAGAPTVLALLEIDVRGAHDPAMLPEVRSRLRDSLAAVLAAIWPGAVASELADFRYGLLCHGKVALPDLLAHINALLRGTPAFGGLEVAATRLELDAGRRDVAQATRALRSALSCFAGLGLAAAAGIGAGGGLAGIVAHAGRSTGAVRAIIAEQRFHLTFQPVVRLSDRAVQHHEALLRPTAGIGAAARSTRDFVTLAEMIGLSEELDWAVLQQALATLGAVQACVAVNVSGLSMQSGSFRARLLKEVLARQATLDHGPGSHLLIELTEAAEIADMASAAKTVAALREAGVAVCLDDFGAGTTNFRYLGEFQVDYVKIDGAHVRAAVAGARERGFVASLVELAVGVGAKVVAEMVETEEQARLMGELGVDLGQGWLFGRPGRLAEHSDVQAASDGPHEP